MELGELMQRPDNVWEVRITFDRLLPTGSERAVSCEQAGYVHELRGNPYKVSETGSCKRL